MENSHFIHRVHNAGNYVLDPKFASVTAETYETILQKFKEVLGNNITEWDAQSYGNMTDSFIITVNNKRIVTSWEPFDGRLLFLIVKANTGSGVITQVTSGGARVQSIDGNTYYNTSYTVN